MPCLPIILINFSWPISHNFWSTTFLEPLFYTFLEKWLQIKWSTEYYSSPLKNGIFFALVLTYRISLGSFFSLYSPFFFVLDQNLILNIA